jgi:hypothetical protein
LYILQSCYKTIVASLKNQHIASHIATIFCAANSCYQGGFKPRDDAPVSKAKQICSTAYANQNNSGTYPPVPMQTLQPTMPSLLPIGKKESNEATAKVAEWVGTNIGGTASAFGKAFPMCIKSSQDLSSSQMIGSARQSLILGSATALVPTRVPTIQPSLAPSITPLLVPTSVSAYNSLQPSIVPTAQPTRVPTLSPSIAPTAIILQSCYKRIVASHKTNTSHRNCYYLLFILQSCYKRS